MRLLFIFLFSLFSTLYSYEIEELLVPSTPQKLSLFEGSPNALIAGLVDPQSRKLSLSVTDLVVKGTQPLQLQRFYSSSPIPGRFDQNGEKDLYQLVDFYNTHPFHDWSYLAHKEIHEISYNPHKKVKKGFKESIYYVPHPNGTTLTFWKSCSSGGFAELRTPLSGMTNVSGERPSGIYHPKNTSLHVSDDKQQLRVTAPDGTIRLYRLAFVTPAKLYVIREGIIKQTAKYILEEEHLTNGKRIIYEWDKKTHRLNPSLSL